MSVNKGIEVSIKSVIVKCAVGHLCLIAVGAADAAVSDDPSEPAIHFGLSIVEKSDSNILSSNANKRSSLVTLISPSVALRAWNKADAYSLAYRADVASYAKSSADNYVDQSFLGTAKLSLSTRALLNLSPEYKIGHDDRGSTYGIGTLVPNTWHSTGVAGSFIYGAEESRGRIVLDAGYQDRQYQNNRAVTTAYDKTLRDLGGALHLRTSPKIYTFVQVTDTHITYKDAASTLNGDERRYLIGATWDATAQTSGSFKIGRLQKKFVSAARPTFRGTSWEGAVRWSPREFVRVDWVSGRKPSESTGVGNFVLVTSNALDFGYDLSERTTLHVNAGKVKEDFAATARVDNTESYGLKAEYKLRSWLVGDVEYTDSVKKSTDPTARYNRNIFAISFRIEF